MPSSNRRQIVTPEAVLIELEVAGIASRFLARLVDALIQVAAIYVVIGVMAVAGGGDGGVVLGLVVGVFAALILLGYPILCEALWNGRTLGKRVVGLRVVTDLGGPVRFRHAALRSVLQIIDFYLTLGLVGLLSALLSGQSQRLGDLAAGTVVVTERRANQVLLPIAFLSPPGWEHYVASLDVSAVTTERYGTLRAYLLRVRDLGVASRQRLAESMATPLARSISHRPPAGMPAEFFLVCVAAAYQLRHGGPFAGLQASTAWSGFGAAPGGALVGAQVAARYGPPPTGPSGAPGTISYGPPGAGQYGPPAAGSYGPAAGSYGPPAVGSYGPAAGSYGPPGAGSYGPPGAGSYGPPGAGSYGPPAVGSYGPPGAGSYGPPAVGSYGPPGSIPNGPPAADPNGPPSWTSTGPPGQPAGQPVNGGPAPGGPPPSQSPPSSQG